MRILKALKKLFTPKPAPQPVFCKDCVYLGADKTGLWGQGRGCMNRKNDHHLDHPINGPISVRRSAEMVNINCDCCLFTPKVKS